jgi:Pseudouridylate synthases, 23S RNA-specific
MREKGKMIIHQSGKPSRTDYTIWEAFGMFSYISYHLLTGRTHQIRLHSQHIGHPIVCDELYGSPNPIFLSAIKKKFNLSKHELEEKPILNRLALHAYKLSFTKSDQTIISVEAPLPKELKAFLNQCRKWLN